MDRLNQTEAVMPLARATGVGKRVKKTRGYEGEGTNAGG